METRIYRYLHEDVIKIRDEVFVEEQQFKEEYDSIDNHCTYLVICESDKPIATCRYYKKSDDTYAIGRIAVIRDRRGRGIGRLIVEEAEAHIKKEGGRFATLSAQLRVREFYEKMGYTAQGQTYYEEYCEHIRMMKKLY